MPKRKSTTKKDTLKPRIIEILSGTHKNVDLSRMVSDAEMPATDEAIEHELLLASMVVSNLATKAIAGHVPAISALQRVGEMVARRLSECPDDKLQQVARQVHWWPTNLSPIKAWNDTRLKTLATDLHLGKNVRSIIDLNQVLKRGSKAKSLCARLIIFTEHCRVLGKFLKALKVGLPTELEILHKKDPTKLSLALNEAAAPLFQEIEESINEISNFIGLRLKAELTGEEKAKHWQTLLEFADTATYLPRPTNDEANLAWFNFAMTPLIAMTQGEYEHENYGLQSIGWAWAEAHGGADNPKVLRNAIRHVLRDTFHDLLANADLSQIEDCTESAILGAVKSAKDTRRKTG